MPAYLIVAGSINDPHKWATYRGAVLPLIQQFGGIHLTGGGGAELLEGAKNTIAIFQFASMTELHAFWESPEYAPIKELRRGVADLNIWAVPSSLDDSRRYSACFKSRISSSADGPDLLPPCCRAALQHSLAGF